MKNLEVKTKKMSIANIEGKLTPAEMENIMAGSGFWGWSDWRPTGGCTNGFQTMVRHYNVFWFRTTYDYNVVSC